MTEALALSDDLEIGDGIVGQQRIVDVGGLNEDHPQR